MNDHRLLLLTSIFILLLAACTAGGEEPAASEAQNTPTPESGLATVRPTAAGNSVDTAQEGEMKMDDEPTPVNAEEDESTPSSEEGIAPVEVDLSEMTPEAELEEGEDDESSEAVEMPEPGRPNPQTAMVTLAKQDLAERLDIEVDEIKVAEVEEMQWSDSSLGCPASDGFYMQVITPGYRITLQAEGESYDYHTDTGRTVVLCGPGGRPVP